MRSTRSAAAAALCLLLAQGVAAASNLPAHWKTCRRSLLGENYIKCMEVAIQEATEDISLNGVPSMSIEPLDPLVIPEMRIQQGRGPAKIDVTFKNFTTHGIQSAKLTEIIKLDFDNLILVHRLNFSKDLLMEADYKMTGNILLMPIKGEGRCTFVLRGVSSLERWTFEKVTKKGRHYLKVKSLSFDFDVVSIKMNFKNLWNGNEAISNTLNSFLNENWRAFLEDMKPAFKEGFGAACMAYANRILSKVPYDEIYPD